jgi:hypothetical protein
MVILSPFITRRSWLWPIPVFVINLAILWMISFVPSCGEGLPQVCEAVRPWSSLKPLLMIAIMLSFPPSILILGLLRMHQVPLCLVYAGLAAAAGLVTLVLYHFNYFVPVGPVTSTSIGCLICDLMFLLQIAVNLGWVFAVVPVGLIRSHQRMLRQLKRR